MNQDPQGRLALGRLTLAISMALGSTLAAAQTEGTAAAGTPAAVPEQTLPTLQVRARTDQAAAPADRRTIALDAQAHARTLQDVVAEQPLVSAPGVGVGASRNKSRFDRGGSTGYNVRGLEGNRVGMDLDGVELPAASTRPYVSRAGLGSFGVGRDQIDPELYTRIEIDPGVSGAARESAGLGGSVSLRTKSAEPFLQGDRTRHLSVKLGGDTVDGSTQAAITAAGRSGPWDGLLVYSRREGRETDNHSATTPANPDDWRSHALLLKGGLKAGQDHRLVLSADLYQRANASAWDTLGTTGTAVASQSTQDSDTRRATLQLQHQWTLPEGHLIDGLQTRLYVQGARTQDATDTLTLSSALSTHDDTGTRSRMRGLSSTADKRIGAHRLSVGLSAAAEDAERPWTVSGVVTPQPDSRTRRVGVFVQDEISLLDGGRLRLTPGLRVDHVETEARNLEAFASSGLSASGAQALYGSPSRHTLVSPSLSLVYDLTPGLKAHAGIRQSHRAPGAGELYGSWNNGSSTASYHLVGNTALQPESGRTVDVGLAGHPAAGVTLSASAFHSQYEDFIAYTRYTRAGQPALFTGLPSTITILYQAENRDEATIYGVETALRLDHGTWTPALAGVYTTWAMGLSRGSSRSSYAGDQDVALDSVQPDKAVIGVGYDAPEKTWGLRLSGTLARAKQAVATNREAYANSGTDLTASTTALFRTPGYGVFHLAGHWQIDRQWRIDASVRNLGDKRYWDYASVRSLQPSVAADQRDIELLTAPGRSVALSLSGVF
ncbi:MAG: hypothetical protein RIQ53_2311 [Pseudomonadota bacterium]